MSIDIKGTLILAAAKIYRGCVTRTGTVGKCSVGWVQNKKNDGSILSLASQTLYRLMPDRTEKSGHSCTHF